MIVKWRFWLALELSVIVGVGVWAYLCPNEILIKGMCGFAVLTLIEKVREILRK